MPKCPKQKKSTHEIIKNYQKLSKSSQPSISTHVSRLIITPVYISHLLTHFCVSIADHDSWEKKQTPSRQTRFNRPFLNLNNVFPMKISTTNIKNISKTCYFLLNFCFDQDSNTQVEEGQVAKHTILNMSL